MYQKLISSNSNQIIIQEYNFKIDKNLFIGEKNLPDSKTSLDSIALNVEHSFNDIWSVNTKAYAANSEFDEKVQLNYFKKMIELCKATRACS